MQSHVSTVELIRAGFDEFPQIAHNDFTVDQFNLVRAAEDNLNANPESANLAQRYVETVKDVSKSIENQYTNYWRNPFKAP